MGEGREGKGRPGEARRDRRGKGRQQRGFSLQLEQSQPTRARVFTAVEAIHGQDSGENTWAVQTADCKASLTAAEARGLAQ